MTEETLSNKIENNSAKEILTFLDNNNSLKTKQYLHPELTKVKDDILLYIKENLNNFLLQIDLYFSKMENIKNNFSSVTNSINSNYKDIISSHANINIKLDKINSFESFINKTNDKLISHELRLNNLSKDFSNTQQKYDKIYLDNLELPGFIGKYSKFKNCKLFFEYIITELNSISKFKEKYILDFNTYKEKIENNIKSFNLLAETNNKAHIKYINELNNKTISDCQKNVDIFEERLKQLRVENANYAKKLNDNVELLDKKLKVIEVIKSEILNNFENKVNIMKKNTENISNMFFNLKQEYKEMENKLTKMGSVIQEIKEEIKTKNINNDNNGQIKFKKLSTKNIKEKYNKNLLDNLNLNENIKEQSKNKKTRNYSNNSQSNSLEKSLRKSYTYINNNILDSFNKNNNTRLSYPLIKSNGKKISEDITITDELTKNKKNNNTTDLEETLSLFSETINKIQSTPLSTINDNKKNITNNILIKSKDKIINELAAELEQSTAKKDISLKFSSGCETISPVNLINNVKDEKEIGESTSTDDKNIYGNDIKINDISKKILNLENYTKSNLKEIISQIEIIKNYFIDFKVKNPNIILKKAMSRKNSIRNSKTYLTNDVKKKLCSNNNYSKDNSTIDIND